MEVSIYIGEKYKGQGIGAALLMNLIKQSEENSIWTLYSAIIEENIASIALHKKWSNLLGKAAGTATSNKARNSPCNYFFI
jgi:GNAT superfamily N-acetyltransferase